MARRMTAGSARILTLLVGVLVLGWGCGPSEPTAVQRAKLLVEAEAGKIWRVAHPSVPKYDELSFDGSEQTTAGCVVKYTYLWSKKRGKRKHRTSLGFHFNAEGSLSDVDVEDVIRVLSDTSLVKPFLAAKIGTGPLRAELKKWIDALPDGADDELKKLMDQKLTPRGLVALWLKYREQHPAK